MTSLIPCVAEGEKGKISPDQSLFVTRSVFQQGKRLLFVSDLMMKIVYPATNFIHVNSLDNKFHRS